MTPAEQDRAVIALVKWRAVLKHATTTKAKLDAVRAIDLIERKLGLNKKAPPMTGGRGVLVLRYGDLHPGRGGVMPNNFPTRS